MSQLSPARKIAREVTALVRERNAYAHNLISTMVNTSQVPACDKAFATLLILGVVSTVGTLDYVINRNLNSIDDVKIDVRDALRISVYELIYLKKEPHAVLDQGVELAKSVAPRAGGLANAVLRKILRDIRFFPWGNPEIDDEALAIKEGFPFWLAQRLIKDLGRDTAAQFMATSNEQAPLFVAVNALRANDDEVLRMLNDARGCARIQEGDPPGCLRVDNAANALRSQALRKGYAVICDASAQLTASSIRLIPGRTYLEVGSGRGTKTILFQSNAQRNYGDQATIYALDIHEYKEKIARERGKVYGLHNVYPITGDARDLSSLKLPAQFDGAFIDAPCSGIGTLRRHPEIRWRITPHAITDMAQNDLTILREVASRIARKGFILFSTCTVMKEENEEVIQRFLDTPQGRQFSLLPAGHNSFINVSLESNGPDAHFAARLVRRI